MGALLCAGGGGVGSRTTPSFNPLTALNQSNPIQSNPIQSNPIQSNRISNITHQQATARTVDKIMKEGHVVSSGAVGWRLRSVGSW